MFEVITTDGAASTPAERTSTRLHDATREGVSLLIPGALEIRSRDDVRAAPWAPVTPPATAVSADERGRLEHQREGGGAPSERRAMRYGVFGQVCHCLLYPADWPLMWRRRAQKSDG